MAGHFNQHIMNRRKIVVNQFRGKHIFFFHLISEFLSKEEKGDSN